MRPEIILTFDVEEFDVPLEHQIDIDLDSQLEVSCHGLDPLLNRLDRMAIPATFFTTGRFAHERPDHLHRMAADHEIASHGFEHGSLEPGDLERSRRLLEELTGRPVEGFRRARMAATPHQEIVEAGYRYNASEHPVWIPGRYNNRRAPRVPYRTGELVNIPASCTPRCRLPLFWLAFRHYPKPVYRRLALQTLRHDGQLNLYFHPWEFTILDRRLPWIIRRGSGPRLLDRLCEFLAWIGKHGDFLTMGQHARTWRDRP